MFHHIGNRFTIEHDVFSSSNCHGLRERRKQNLGATTWPQCQGWLSARQSISLTMDELRGEGGGVYNGVTHRTSPRAGFQKVKAITLHGGLAPRKRRCAPLVSSRWTETEAGLGATGGIEGFLQGFGCLLVFLFGGRYCHTPTSLWPLLFLNIAHIPYHRLSFNSY
jgi:hypothetical protein